jgi:hypothetical protein
MPNVLHEQINKLTRYKRFIGSRQAVRHVAYCADAGVRCLGVKPLRRVAVCSDPKITAAETAFVEVIDAVQNGPFC